MITVSTSARFRNTELGIIVQDKNPPSQFSPFESCSILVVDDENGPRQALRMLLKEFYEVHLAANVSEALRILEQERIDLVITDLRMPQQSGVELLRRVKETSPGIQVIILTGYGELDTAVKAVEYGAFAYLEKPFDNNAMLKQVEMALAKCKQEHERRALENLALEANRFDTLGQVVSGMIHDLGTPLSVIGSHLEMMLCSPKKENLDSRIQVMLSQVHHCGDIVRATMNFLRAQPKQTAPFNLNDVVDTCIQVGRPFLHQQKVTVRRDLAPDIGQCVGNFTLVRQAILNLITNACQAMEKALEKREIHIRTWAEEGHACLSVQDTGPGIRPEDRQKVFDTFYSTKGERGTGLGLAVVKNVMNRHGGEVLVGDTEGGTGALFILKFPTHPADSATPR